VELRVRSTLKNPNKRVHRRQSSSWRRGIDAVVIDCARRTIGDSHPSKFDVWPTPHESAAKESRPTFNTGSSSRHADEIDENA
jgi:hypothetical protein